MLVTLPGIVIDVNLLQPKNVELPMLVTLFGMMIDVKLLQPENADSPMLVTLFGMMIDFISRSSAKFSGTDVI